MTRIRVGCECLRNAQCYYARMRRVIAEGLIGTRPPVDDCTLKNRATCNYEMCNFALLPLPNEDFGRRNKR